ncbi:hypothetical protein [Rhodococcus opacus]|uniref:Uncharacterized protein n=1 Tax=Rhodococcus opacus (strain B4) TaxID=632772 RepID=C1B9B0_RHOOB|nr:hypothetical protein [Rhodococcus opacus]BAH52263.1 hypothetical protein ROP_40160 [Rhodococcus opacus B4]
MTDNVEALQRHLDGAKSIRTWLISERDKLGVYPASRGASIRSELSKLDHIVERLERELKQARKQADDEARVVELAMQLTYVRHTAVPGASPYTLEQFWQGRTPGQKQSWIRVAETAIDLIGNEAKQQIAVDGNPITLSRIGHVGRVVTDADVRLGTGDPRTKNVDPNRRIQTLGEAASKAIDSWDQMGGNPW